MAWTLCTSGSATVKASVNANSGIKASGSQLANWSDEAESLACGLARYDVVTNWATLTANGKEVLQDFTSSHIAQKIVSYDPDSIGRSTATLILNILENNVNTAKQIISDKNQRTFLGIET